MMKKRNRHRLLCRIFGCHLRIVWAKVWGEPQWIAKCMWCGDWECVPANRYDIHFGGEDYSLVKGSNGPEQV
jgi:hypothetical protein